MRKRKNRSTTTAAVLFRYSGLSFEREGQKRTDYEQRATSQPSTDVQTIEENLRDAAYHEAGHVVVARFWD